MSPSTQAVQILAAWFSPAYPVGSYSYSHGLEWAISAGEVTDAASLEASAADFEGHEIPREICDSFDDELITSPICKQLYATLGQFTIIRLERETQLLMPVYDYCIPDKECAAGSEEDPCTLFSSIPFPVSDFFPPQGDPAKCTTNGTCSTSE